MAVRSRKRWGLGILSAGVLWLASPLPAMEEAAFQKLTKLPDKEMAQAAELARAENEEAFSPAQLCELAKRFMARTDDDEYGLGQWVFEKACREGDARTLPRLTQLFVSLPREASFERGVHFGWLADLWLRVRAVDWKQHPPVLAQLPEEKRELSESIRAWPADLQNAWRTAQQVMAVRQSWQVPPDRWVAFQNHQADFWKVIDDLLEGKGKVWSGDLARYVWAGGCGTGSEEFAISQTPALAMAFLAENRSRDAVVAALLVPDFAEFGFGYPRNGMHQLLRDSRFDWQRAMVGFLVEAANDGSCPWAIDEWRRFFLGNLVSRGDAASARAILELARLAPESQKRMYLHALAGYIAPGPLLPGKEAVPADWRDFAREAAEIPPGLQVEMLAELCGAAKEKNSFEQSKDLAEMFGGLRRPEAREALELILQSPSFAVAQAASAALEGIGVKAEIRPRLAPVRYQLRLNGQPLVEQEVRWLVKQDHAVPNGIARTDRDGVISLPAETFLDPVHTPETVFLSAAAGKSPADLWFLKEAPLPAGQAEPIVVKAETKPFAVRVIWPEGFSPTAGELRVSMKKGPGEGSFERVLTAALSPSAALHFGGLSPGIYRFEIDVPSMAPWAAEVDTAGTDSMDAVLPPAHGVRFALVMPEGWRAEEPYPLLFRNGNVLNMLSPARSEKGWIGYDRLPPGRYVLKFSSSEEMRRIDPGWVPSSAPGFAGMEVPFEIKADSPLLIDLGELRPKAR